jgi:hypothetical protein
LAEVQSGHGGGIYDAEKSSVTLNGSSSVNKNIAQKGVGGGIYVETRPNAENISTFTQGHLTFGPGWNGTVSENLPDNVFPLTCSSGC